MLIKNGLLIDPVKETEYVADIRISDGKIAEIGEIWWQQLRKKSSMRLVNV